MLQTLAAEPPDEPPARPDMLEEPLMDELPRAVAQFAPTARFQDGASKCRTVPVWAATIPRLPTFRWAGGIP